jgi:hypothetical protein
MSMIAVTPATESTNAALSSWCASRRTARLDQLYAAVTRDAYQLLCWHVFWVFGSGCSDETQRRTFQPRCYGRAHAGTEGFIHFEMADAVRSVCLDFVVVAH